MTVVDPFWFIPTLHLKGEREAIALLLTEPQQRLIRLQYPDATNPFKPKLLFGLPVIILEPDDWATPALLERRHERKWKEYCGAGLPLKRAAIKAITDLFDTELRF